MGGCVPSCHLSDPLQKTLKGRVGETNAKKVLTVMSPSLPAVGWERLALHLNAHSPGSNLGSRKALSSLLWRSRVHTPARVGHLPLSPPPALDWSHPYRLQPHPWRATACHICLSGGQDSYWELFPCLPLPLPCPISIPGPITRMHQPSDGLARHAYPTLQNPIWGPVR